MKKPMLYLLMGVVGLFALVALAVEMKTCQKCNGSGMMCVFSTRPGDNTVKKEKCDLCKGTGRIPADFCISCKGTGKIYKKGKLGYTKCPDCKGTGKIAPDACSYCQGTGKDCNGTGTNGNCAFCHGTGKAK